MHLSSLNSHLNWQQVLPLLGVVLRSRVLPAIVSCPVCHAARMHIYDDPKVGGQWACCRGCLLHGDMIELAAAAWKLDIATAIKKMAVCGLDLHPELMDAERVQRYKLEHVDNRKRMEIFWHKAQARFASSDTPELRALQRAIMGQSPPLNGWLPHGGQFIGAASKQDVGQIFATRVHKGGRQPTLHGLFPGPDWADVLVIPFYDLPGRLYSFLFVGRNANPATDFVFRRIWAMVKSGAYEQDAGVAMMPAALLPVHGVLGHSVFAINDPFLATRLQLQGLQDCLLPLPIIGLYRNTVVETKSLQHWKSGADLIFWAPRLNISTIIQARYSGAQVSILEADPADVIDPNRLSSLGWLMAIKAKAMGWRAALQHLLRPASIERLDELLCELNLPDIELRKVIATADPLLKGKMTQLLNSRNYVRRIEYAGKTFTEHDEGWFLGNSRICDAIVRLEQVLSTTEGRTYYRGVIQFHGETVPFTDKTEAIDENLFKWARQWLRSQGKGLLTFSRRWCADGVHIAAQFHQPTPVASVDIIGWSQEQRQYNFPTFSLTHQGGIKENFTLLDDDRIPARLPRPTTPSRILTAQLSERNDEVLIFWATAACVISNVVSYALGQPQVGTILDGPGAVSIGTSAARKMGCGATDSRHNWPALVPHPKGYSLAEWLEQLDVQTGVIPLPWLTARSVGIRDKWNIVSCQRKLGSPQLISPAANCILPSYLQDLAQRRFWINHRHVNPAYNLMHDLADWFARICGGDADTVRAASQMLIFAGQFPVWKHFAQMLCYLRVNGQLEFDWASHRFQISQAGRPSLIEMKEEGRPAEIWIPQRSLSDEVEREAGVPLDPLLITKSLQDAGILLSESVYLNERGWLVTEAWLDEQLVDWNRHRHV